MRNSAIEETTLGAKPQIHATGFWLFLVLAAVYLLSYSGGIHAIDEVSVTAMTESLVKHGQVSTDQIVWSQGWTPAQGRYGPDGHLYSKKGLGSALLGAPFYWAALQLPDTGEIQALMLANALVTALSGWLVYRCVLRLGYRPSVAAITALGFGLGTMAWPYAKFFFSEPLTTLGLLLAFWGLLVAGQTAQSRYSVVSGVGLGLALLSKVSNGVAWPLFLLYGLWVVYRWRKDAPADWRKRLVVHAGAFLVPLAISCIVLGAYDLVRTGYLLDLGYDAEETFSTPILEGLAGLLVSPGKSLFVYSPLLLATLFGIPTLWRRDRPASLLSLGIVAAYLLLYARWYMWWGGWSWGPRFLVPVLPFLSLFLAPVVERALEPSRLWLKGLLAALGLGSVFIQILGATVDFNTYLGSLYLRGIDSAAVNFRADITPLLGHWDLLRAGVVDLFWAREMSGGTLSLRLIWPLALFAVAALGWLLTRRFGRLALSTSGMVGIALLVYSAVVMAHLSAPADDWQKGTEALSELLQQSAQPGDAMVVDLWGYADHMGLTATLLERYKALPAYWTWPREDPVSAGRQELLADMLRQHHQLWLTLGTTPDGDEGSSTERWLDEHAFRVENRWLSPAMRLVRYQSPPDGLAEAPQALLGLRLGDRLQLAGFSPAGPLKGKAGDLLTFSLFWQAEEAVKQDYVVFVQLLDGEGKLRAQVDRQPVGALQPTHAWQPGQVIRDNYALMLPPDLPFGQYQLIVGFYLPANMERLPVSTDGGKQVGDYVPLTSVAVSK